MGEDLVAFKDDKGRYGLIGRHCPHRGTDLAYGRLEDGGLRCAFHGWLFDVNGKCLQTPAEPDNSNLCANIRQKSYPVVEKSGILFAYLGPGEPPAFPDFDCFVAPATHTFAFKGMIDCNWLQSLEVGIDPVHTSFLHRFFEDEDPDKGYGRMFRDKSKDSDMPMTRIMRDFPRPRIEIEPTDYGFRLITLRQISDEKAHVRVTNLIFPNAFIIPMSREMTISQWHVPIDDVKHYWYAIFTSFGAAVDKDEMRRQRLELYELPDYVPRKNKSNDYGFDAARAGARDLYRHGRRHQRARPVGLRIHGRHPGPHPGASRHVRQGDQRLSPAAAAGARAVRQRRAADDGARCGASGHDHRPGLRRRHRSGRRLAGLLAAHGRGPAKDQKLGEWAVNSLPFRSRANGSGPKWAARRQAPRGIRNP